jgi:hypothetical protein
VAYVPLPTDGNSAWDAEPWFITGIALAIIADNAASPC